MLTGAGQEAFLVSSGRIVTLRPRLCKWFLRWTQLSTCGAIDKEEAGSSIQSADIKMSKLKIPTELFGKVLVFIRFDDYNYIVIL